MQNHRGAEWQAGIILRVFSCIFLDTFLFRDVSFTERNAVSTSFHRCFNFYQMGMADIAAPDPWKMCCALAKKNLPLFTPATFP